MRDKDRESLLAWNEGGNQRIGRGVIQVGIEQFVKTIREEGGLNIGNVEIMVAVLEEVKDTRGSLLELQAVDDPRAMWKKIKDMAIERGIGGLRELWPHLTMGDLVTIAETAMKEDGVKL